MTPIEIQICMGTTCFVLCNSELEDIQQMLDEKVLPYVQISGATCLGLCKDSEYKRVPCAKVDGVMLEDVNLHDLTSYITQVVEDKFLIGDIDGK